MEGFQDYHLPLKITFIDLKEDLRFHRQECNVCCSAALRYTCGGESQRHQCIVHQLQKCSIGRLEYFWSLWPFYRSPAGWCFSSISLHYSRWLPYWGRSHQILTLELKHTLVAQDDIQPRYWMTWTSPTTLPCWNAQWPGHRPSSPVQHQQQNILALELVFPRQSTYMNANCNPQLSLQVYCDPINHVTDFKYLDSKMASAASNLKRRKAFAWSAFL